jgi:hypothetical protein
VDVRGTTEEVGVGTGTGVDLRNTRSAPPQRAAKPPPFPRLQPDLSICPGRRGAVRIGFSVSWQPRSITASEAIIIL